jgi:predicted acetyltransferase
MMQLLAPSEDCLPSYVAALRRGWSPNNERGRAAAEEELEQIELDAKGFIRSLDDREGKGPPVKMPDGSTVPRLPGFRRWMWDGQYAGNIVFRWQPGTPALPAYCLGHIGYSVVPWKQRRGYATSALLSMLKEARAMEMPYVEITTDPDNLPSQKVVLAAGGKLVEKFMKPPQFGSKPALRFRISLI